MNQNRQNKLDKIYGQSTTKYNIHTVIQQFGISPLNGRVKILGVPNSGWKIPRRWKLLTKTGNQNI